MLRRIVPFFLACVLLPVLSAAPSLVILVRHAEKEAEPAKDPQLTAAGRERAAELANVVAVLSTNAPIRAIFATEFFRTRETVKPLSQASGVAILESKDDVVAKVLAVHGGTVVIAGHSNTIPDLIQKLGGPAGVTIGDPEFNHLYMISMPGTAKAKFASLTYGK